MIEIKRIDQYLCIDIEKVIVDEMRYIIETENTSDHPEDIRDWSELQAAAHVIVRNYAVPGEDDADRIAELEAEIERLEGALKRHGWESIVGGDDDNSD